MNTGVGFCKTRVNDWARVCMVSRPSFDSRYAAGTNIAALQSAPTTHVRFCGCCGGLWPSRLSSTSGQNAAVRQSLALVLDSRSNAMVLRILGSLLTGVVGAHDSHGCSHGSNAFCRPRHGVFRPRPAIVPWCGVPIENGGNAKFAKYDFIYSSRMPWRLVAKLYMGFWDLDCRVM